MKHIKATYIGTQHWPAGMPYQPLHKRKVSEMWFNFAAMATLLWILIACYVLIWGGVL